MEEENICPTSELIEEVFQYTKDRSLSMEDIREKAFDLGLEIKFFKNSAEFKE